MLVAFPFGDPAVFSCQLKDVLHQRTPTHLIHWNLRKNPTVIDVIKLAVKIIKEMLHRIIADLWISGMLWTQNLKSFTVGFALGIVHIAEKSSGSEKEEQCLGL